ncbi:hypothetical protein EDB85DRAFT_2027628 [Lactarius pseudohatsudake]|nr:hypothetical protein EDB85DRAFT_2043374 [Lactarius pseudohatsudake]KAH9015096.1 hypothetical protein EDB85DRAFT_2027628 [Lactarius pseudohatsudake]
MSRTAVASCTFVVAALSGACGGGVREVARDGACGEAGRRVRRRGVYVVGVCECGVQRGAWHDACICVWASAHRSRAQSARRVDVVVGGVGMECVRARFVRVCSRETRCGKARSGTATGSTLLIHSLISVMPSP